MKLKVILPILFVVLGLFSPKDIFAQSKVPSFSFSPPDITLSIGQEVTSTIIIDTAGYSVGGAGVVIKFDPSIVSVKSLERGPDFVDYPLVFFDNSTGEIRLSGVVSSKDALFTGTGIIGKITWKGVALGRTYATFDFTRGSTKDSNIAVLTGAGDVLESVSYLTLIVQSQAAPTNPPASNETQDETAPAPETLKEMPLVGRILQVFGVSTSNNDPEGPIKNQVPNNIKSINQPVVEKLESNNTITIKIVAIIVASITGAIIIVILLIQIIRKVKKSLNKPNDPTGTHFEAQL